MAGNVVSRRNSIIKVILILGAVMILALLILLYFFSNKVAAEIEARLNNGMEEMKGIIDSPSKWVDVKWIEYSPFKCSGMLDYECKSDFISIKLNYPIGLNAELEDIRLNNISISSKDINNKNKVSLNVSSEIEYPSNLEFLKSPVNEYMNDILLPNKLDCIQDFSHYKDSKDDVDTDLPPAIFVNNICKLKSEAFGMTLKTNSIFATNSPKTHILSLIYDIIKDINDSNNVNDIPYELESAGISLESAVSFREFIEKNEKISPKDKSNIINVFETLALTGKSSIAVLLALNGAYRYNAILDAIYNFAMGSANKVDILFSLKDSPKFEPVTKFLNMDTFEIMQYLDKNYKLDLEIQSASGTKTPDIQDDATSNEVTTQAEILDELDSITSTKQSSKIAVMLHDKNDDEMDFLVNE